MANLYLDSLGVDVLAGFQVLREPLVTRRRRFSNAMDSTTRGPNAYARAWAGLRTEILPISTGTAVLGFLETAGDFPASGDVVGSPSVTVRPRNIGYRMGPGADHMQVEFDLVEVLS